MNLHVYLIESEWDDEFKDWYDSSKELVVSQRFNGKIVYYPKTSYKDVEDQVIKILDLGSDLVSKIRWDWYDAHLDSPITGTMYDENNKPLIEVIVR